MDSLLAKYPGAALSADSVYKLIGGKVLLNHINDPENFENSCALRMSRALNYSGYPIPYISGQTGSGSDGKWYFYKISDLETYLRGKYGAPSDMTYSERPSKKGIIIFTDCDFSDATV